MSGRALSRAYLEPWDRNSARFVGKPQGLGRVAVFAEIGEAMKQRGR